MQSIVSKRGLISSVLKVVFACRIGENRIIENSDANNRRKLASSMYWSDLLTNPGALGVKQVFILVKTGAVPASCSFLQ